jgi:(1->4)-alpha-D-glucan 1-alpha-D-glucosylmutase
VDVVENGPSSPYASYFDVDWEPPEARLRNCVLLPVLGAQYGRVLEAFEIQIAREGAAFVIRYYDHKFPLREIFMEEQHNAGPAADELEPDEVERPVQ